MTLRRYAIAIVLILPVGCGRNGSPPPSSNHPVTIAESKPKEAERTSVGEQWPFDDAENAAVISFTRIMDGSQPILYVVHDEEGDWQFLDGGDVSEEDAATVSLKRVAQHDPSVKSLADLPVGWAAERAGVDQEWQRFQR